MESGKCAAAVRDFESFVSTLEHPCQSIEHARLAVLASQFFEQSICSVWQSESMWMCQSAIKQPDPALVAASFAWR